LEQVLVQVFTHWALPEDVSHTCPPEAQSCASVQMRQPWAFVVQVWRMVPLQRESPMLHA